MLIKRLLIVAALLTIVVSPIGCVQTPVVRHSEEANERSLLSAFVSLTDLRMSSVRQNLEILGSTPEANSGNWKNIAPLLSAYQKSDDGLVVWFLLPDGSYYTVDKGQMGVKLSDRDYFSDIMSGRKIMGALDVSKSTEQCSAVIAAPIIRGGKVIGAIGASLFLGRLSEQIGSSLQLPEDVTFFALAPNGLTTLHKKADRHFLDPRELGSETLKKAANEILANTKGATNYEFDNTIKRAIYSTSPLTHWKFAISFSETGQK